IEVIKVLTSVHEDENIIAAGDEVEYTITVINNGPATAGTVTLYDDLPAEIENPHYTLNDGESLSWPANGELEFNNMVSGAEHTIVITGTAGCPPPGVNATVINTATVELAEPLTDPDLSNNESSVTVTLIDNTPPEFTAGLLPGYEECVDMLYQAIYDSQEELLRYLLDYNSNFEAQPYLIDNLPAIEDYHLFVRSSEELDLQIEDITDNCCDLTESDIEWTITFDANTPNSRGGTTISGTGQPSNYMVNGERADIKLWGDRVGFNTLTHTITYIITDCHGNESIPVIREIIIKPRPEIIKITGAP
ncbi:MAG: DUF11 domain-containing protein, partial [Lentisphaerae bacterium]|nr:DUF11 domain-containing protein [Lentisphaerota bacterium]